MLRWTSGSETCPARLRQPIAGSGTTIRLDRSMNSSDLGWPNLVVSLYDSVNRQLFIWLTISLCFLFFSPCQVKTLPLR